MVLVDRVAVLRVLYEFILALARSEKIEVVADERGGRPFHFQFGDHWLGQPVGQGEIAQVEVRLAVEGPLLSTLPNWLSSATRSGTGSLARSRPTVVIDLDSLVAGGDVVAILDEP